MYPSRAAACQRQWRCPGVRTLWISLLLQGLLDMSASGESNLKLHIPPSSDSLHTFPTMMRSVNRDGCTWSPGPVDHLSCAVCLFVCFPSWCLFFGAPTLCSSVGLRETVCSHWDPTLMLMLVGFGDDRPIVIVKALHGLRLDSIGRQWEALTESAGFPIVLLSTLTDKGCMRFHSKGAAAATWVAPT